ncbi:tyrosine-type recombinase/integrase [uncultured Dysosmobacter sp.]|uniref:tyrosine-type recombinase/integrase n=1 Tax=uncultured Dysosmobacter sp. TaxID=2591384 RepID=UPI0026088B1E|nr:tyrosine-type recombinase/integrase [uncultured Dysosmobacter sp.]
MTQTINRPDETAMRRLLTENPDNTIGIILRLAWLQGMAREEICNLTWADISMEKNLILLGDRSIPLAEETRECILRRIRRYGRLSPYVVISEKYQDQMAPGSVSRVVRKALDKEGLRTVRLLDLRHDYIIRQMATHSWAYVIRVSGLSVGTFQATYAKLNIHKRMKTEKLTKENGEYDMWKILQENRSSMEGIALWLRWQMDLQLTELAELTWDQVDFQANVLRLKNRTLPLAVAVRDILEKEQARRGPKDDPHVLLTPNTRRPVDVARLSKAMRTVLICGNIETVSIRNLHGTMQKDLDKERIMQLARAKGSLVRGEVMETLQISSSMAHDRLRELVEAGKLVKVLSTYYLPGTTVPEERQEAVIVQYLRENKTGYLVEFAKLLGLKERQCGRILKKLALDGKVVKKGAAYTLPNRVYRMKAAKPVVQQPDYSLPPK